MGEKTIYCSFSWFKDSLYLIRSWHALYYFKSYLDAYFAVNLILRNCIIWPNMCKMLVQRRHSQNRIPVVPFYYYHYYYRYYFAVFCFMWPKKKSPRIACSIVIRANTKDVLDCSVACVRAKPARPFSNSLRWSVHPFTILSSGFSCPALFF